MCPSQYPHPLMATELSNAAAFYARLAEPMNRELSEKASERRVSSRSVKTADFPAVIKYLGFSDKHPEF